jgi:hypothetical protein
MRYREDFDYDDYRAPAHSLFGIASFLIVLAAGLLELGLLVIAGVLDARSPGGLDENSPQAILLGLALIGGLFIDIVGIALGVVGLCHGHCNKAFAWLGVGIGATVGVGMLFVMAVGVLLG